MASRVYVIVKENRSYSKSDKIMSFLVSMVFPRNRSLAILSYIQKFQKCAPISVYVNRANMASSSNCWYANIPNTGKGAMLILQLDFHLPDMIY